MANQKENEKGAMIHTYAEDLAEEIKKEQGGAYRLALEEEKRREEEKKEFSPFSKQNLLFGFFSLILLGLAGAVIFFFFLKNQETVPSKEPGTVMPQAFLIGNTKEISLGTPTKEKILKAIKDELTQAEEGQILSLNFTEEKNVLESAGEKTESPLTLRRLMFILEIKAPELLLKSLSEEFALGIYKKEPFFVLKIEAFNNAFRGMREWERTLAQNLSNLLGLDLSTLKEESVFKDSLIKNQDVRLLENESGEIILIYGLKGERFAVIAKNSDLLFEIMSRLVL